MLGLVTWETVLECSFELFKVLALYAQDLLHTVNIIILHIIDTV